MPRRPRAHRRLAGSRPPRPRARRRKTIPSSSISTLSASAPVTKRRRKRAFAALPHPESDKEPGRPWTVGRLVQYGARRFRRYGLAFGHGLPDARAEAAYLAAHALGLPRASCSSRLSRRLNRMQVAHITALFLRRIRERKPAAYLTGEAWLGDVRFQVDERVLVPRSYIAELLREQLAPWIPDPASIRTALDLCTGSGCLAILLAHALPRARVDAADVSPDALAVARINVDAHCLRNRVRLVRSDMFSGLRARRYDLIVSNPPYVRAAAMRRLPPEYRAEPALALAGGRRGLDFVHALLRAARPHLNPGGWLLVEAGHSRAQLERAYPRTAFVWAETSGGDDCVFLLNRDQLPGSPRRRGRAAASRRAPRQRRAGTSGHA